jgi:hypothetical protein
MNLWTTFRAYSVERDGRIWDGWTRAVAPGPKAEELGSYWAYRVR